MRRREFISLLYSNLGQVVSAEFDSGNRQWVAVEVEMLRTEISDVDRLPVLTAARAMASPGPRRNTAPAPPLRRVYAAGNAPWRATRRTLDVRDRAAPHDAIGSDRSRKPPPCSEERC